MCPHSQTRLSTELILVTICLSPLPLNEIKYSFLLTACIRLID